MKYNKLGGSELYVSALGLGCMSLDIHKAKEFSSILRTAYEHGVNFFDTADLYDKGLNEILVGKAVKSYRKDVVLATKVGNRWNIDGKGWSWDVSQDYIEQAVDNSLRRLQTDYIDLYQVHGGTNKDDMDSVVETMENLIKKGKIRHYGISSIRPNVFLKYLEFSHIVSNMMQYSVLDNRPESFIDSFLNHNVSLIARGVLAKGILVNKSPVSYLDYTQDEVKEVQSKVKEMAGNFSVRPTSICLGYVLRNPIVASALIGIRNLEQLEDAVKAYRVLNGLEVNYQNLPIKTLVYKDHLI